MSLVQVDGEGVVAYQVCHACPVAIELDSWARPVDQQVSDGGLCRVSVVEHHPAYTDFLQHLCMCIDVQKLTRALLDHVFNNEVAF